MLKEHISMFRKLLATLDLALVVAAFFAGYHLSDGVRTLNPLHNYVNLIPLILLIWGCSLSAFGVYDSFRLKSSLDVLGAVFKAGLTSFIIFGGVTYLFKIPHISRAFIISFFLISTLLISLEKMLLIAFLRRLRSKGLNSRNLLLVGSGEKVKGFLELIDRHSYWGIKVLGIVGKDDESVPGNAGSVRLLGTFKDIPSIIRDNVIDEVVFAIPRSWLADIDNIEKMMGLFEEAGIKIHISLDYFDMKYSSAKQTSLDEFPFLTFESAPSHGWMLFLKRLFDVLGSALGILVLSPFLLLVACVIKFTSKGNVIFRQKRCGLYGREFTLYKFRTMVPNAESRLDELQKYNEMGGPVFKMRNDPRVTAIGRIFRKFSVDELPQLWNVLKGDMSLVGPRPAILSEVSKYDPWQRRRLSMRPGLTCLWQVSGRNRITSFKDWMELDLKYIDNWSLWLDIKILLQTVPIVLLGYGAK